jgi:MFS family permease
MDMSGSESTTDSRRESIWTRTFVLLCAVQFLGYAQHFVLQPTFPLYITHLGGSPIIVGLVIASFGVASVLSRPIIGYWADRWSETGVLILGLLGQALSISLCFIPSAGATMLANGLRGIGWSGMTTGGYTLLATSAPAERRGEASGYYGAVQSCATIIFPAVALWIIDAPFGGFYAVFVLAMALASAGALTGASLSRQVARAPRRRQSEQSESWWRDIVSVFDRDILLAATLLFTSHLSLPCLTSFAVLYARELGIGHFGWFFVVTGVTSVLARPLLGRVSDRIGCGRSLIAAFALESGALVILSYSGSLFGMMLSGALYFMGTAIGGARILALAMERAPVERRGRAMASFSVAFPLSNGLGALLNGLAVDLAGYSWMYMIAAAICACGLALTAKNWSLLK